MVQHDVQSYTKQQVLGNRVDYAGFYILSVIEMLKYAVKEDYDNTRSEIQVMGCQLEYCKPS